MMNKIHILFLLLIRVAKFLILSRHRFFYITSLIFWVSILFKIIYIFSLYLFEPYTLLSSAILMSNDPLLIPDYIPPLIDELTYNPYPDVESLTETDAFALYDVISENYTILSDSFKANLDIINSKIKVTLI